jgi:hypothetical protein
LPPLQKIFLATATCITSREGNQKRRREKRFSPNCSRRIIFFGSWQQYRIRLKLYWEKSLVTDMNTYKAALIDSCSWLLTSEFEDQSEATWIRSEAGELRSLPRDKLKKKTIKMLSCTSAYKIKEDIK